jgi:DNA invertase Pin-like site-specific DNA recombinase
MASANNEDSDNSPIKRAVVYIRVSTEDQAEHGYSLKAQENRLRSYCNAREWEIVNVYIDDGYSGRNIDRPSYSAMLKERDNWDILVVMKMDRIHRNSKNFTTMMDQLKAWGKEFISMQESFDTSTAMGRFVMDIIQRIAQLESEQISERVKLGLRQKAEENTGYLGFNIPYGYDYNDGELKINPTEAIVVKDIFSNYYNGSTIQKIVDELNSAEIPTKFNRRWAKATVLAILRNPVYCGYYRWKKYLFENKHEPIVTVSVYNGVQRKRCRSIRNKSLRKNPVKLIDIDNCELVVFC